MRKWLVMSLIGALVLIPAAAFADVDIDVDIQKDKRKVVFEQLVKFKAAVILALVVQITDKAAESETLVNQTNTYNFEEHENHLSQAAVGVSGSGIVSTNNASGNMNNQANAVSVAVAGSSASTNGGNDDSRLFFGGIFVESQAAADQKNTFNKIDADESRSESQAFVTGTGIVSVNNSSGSMNNQANAVSVAVGFGRTLAGVALSEADLGQVNAFNRVELERTSSTSIASVNGSGIVSVNNSSGHMNNQANVVSVAAITSRSAVATVGP